MDNKYVEQYTDINVEGVEFYVASEPDGYLYKEAACENKVTSIELKHAFEMNDVVVVDGDYKYRPEVFGVNENGSFVIYDKVTFEDETMVLVPTQVIGYKEVTEEETTPETTPETEPETTPETVPPTTGE